MGMPSMPIYTGPVLIHAIVRDNLSELQGAVFDGLHSPHPKVVNAATILRHAIESWPDDDIVIARVNGFVVGFSVYNVIQGDLHLLEIGSLTDAPGVGTNLMKEMISTGRKYGARTILLNPGTAKGFYTKMGFTVIGNNLMARET